MLLLLFGLVQLFSSRIGLTERRTKSLGYFAGKKPWDSEHLKVKVRLVKSQLGESSAPGCVRTGTLRSRDPEAPKVR